MWKIPVFLFLLVNHILYSFLFIICMRCVLSTKKNAYLSYLSSLQYTSLMTSQLSQYNFHFSKQSVKYSFEITISYLVIFSLIFSTTFQCWLHLGKYPERAKVPNLGCRKRQHIWVMWCFAKKIIIKKRKNKTNKNWISHENEYNSKGEYDDHTVHKLAHFCLTAK